MLQTRPDQRQRTCSADHFLLWWSSECFCLLLSAIAWPPNPTVTGSIQCSSLERLRRFCPHSCDHRHALMLTFQTHPCGKVASASVTIGSHYSLDWTTELDYWTHPKWCEMPSRAFFQCRSKANHIYSAYLFATFAFLAVSGRKIATLSNVGFL